jgi:hypothetical protein
MQDLIETVVRFVGWLVLTVVTLGRYRSRGQRDLLVEGAIGLLSIALALAAVYRWWPA